MTHWKEIEEKHNKLVDLLIEKKIIDIEATWLYTQAYIEEKLKKNK